MTATLATGQNREWQHYTHRRCIEPTHVVLSLYLYISVDLVISKPILTLCISGMISTNHFCRFNLMYYSPGLSALEIFQLFKLRLKVVLMAIFHKTYTTASIAWQSRFRCRMTKNRDAYKTIIDVASLLLRLSQILANPVSSPERHTAGLSCSRMRQESAGSGCWLRPAGLKAQRSRLEDSSGGAADAVDPDYVSLWETPTKLMNSSPPSGYPCQSCSRVNEHAILITSMMMMKHQL